MKDLHETLFYNIKFTVQAKRENSDLLWDIVVLIKEWMTKKHNRKSKNLTTDIHQWSTLKNGGQIVGNRIKIISESCFVEIPFSATYWACMQTENRCYFESLIQLG